MQKWNNQQTKLLARAFLSLKKEDDVLKFMRDLMTENEILEFGRRWQAANMLAKNVSYSLIQKETGLSSTTVARIAKWLNSGTSGYRNAINIINHHSP